MATPDAPEDLSHLGSFGEFSSYFSNSTERGAALGAVALLDSYVGECLKAIMVPDEEMINAEFGGDGNLAGFGARIRLARLLGLIERVTYRELSFIGKIRNEFAHKKDADNFKQVKVQGCVSSLMIMRNRTALMRLVYYGSGFRHPKGITLEKAAQTWLGSILKGFDPTDPRWAFMLAVPMITLCFMRLEKTLRENPRQFEAYF